MTGETSMTAADGRFVTFAGGGFGTMQIERVVGSEPAPGAASGPGHLRNQLPDLYRESDFAMRFLAGFELVLDPLLAMLDNLPEHFDSAYAPRDVLNLLTRWLGLEHDESRSGEERRRLLQRAPELLRRRGTRSGLELALELAFPGVPFRIEERGTVTWALEQPGDVAEEPPSFVVYCDVPLAAERLAAVVRVIDQAKPAHVSFRLRVRAAATSEGPET
jgi:phage tail-like protein